MSSDIDRKIVAASRHRSDELHSHIRDVMKAACPGWRLGFAGAAIETIRVHREKCTAKVQPCGSELLHMAGAACVLGILADIEEEERKGGGSDDLTRS